jgi:hypothetical protein
MPDMIDLIWGIKKDRPNVIEVSNNVHKFGGGLG